MRIAGLLLAAGGGTRFGGRKQLAAIDGRPLLRRSLETLAPVFGADLYAVLGAFRDEIRPLAADLARVIENAHWRQGLGSSIAVGVEAIRSRERYDGILIALADQVALQSDDYARLLQHFDGIRPAAA